MPGRKEKPGLLFFFSLISTVLGFILMSIVFYLAPLVLSKNGLANTPAFLDFFASSLIKHHTFDESWHRFALLGPFFFGSLIFFFLAWISTKIIDKRDLHLPEQPPSEIAPEVLRESNELIEKSFFEKYPLLTILLGVIGVFLSLALIEYLLGVYIL